MKALTRPTPGALLRRVRLAATRRLAARLLVLGVLAAPFAFLAPDSASAATGLPPDFEQVVITDGLDLPMDFDFAPDGRIFVAEKSGTVRVIEDGALVPDPVIDISSRVNAYGDRGLYSVAVDPDFLSNGYIYLLYTYEHNSGSPQGGKSGRLSRFTVVDNVANVGSEYVVLGSSIGNSCEDFPVGADCLAAEAPVHAPDSLRFAPDGTLFVSTGDAKGNYVGELSLRAQDLDSLAGKILRIHPDGSGVEGNPFWNGDPSANRSKLWARGFRNPFRMSFNPETGDIFAGDVGWASGEEVDIVHPGGNYGWPCYETPARQPGYEPFPECQALYLLEPDGVEAPFYWYPSSLSYGSCITGGDFPLAYPAPFDDGYLFGECAYQRLSYISLNDDGSFASVQVFATFTGLPTSIRTGPNGEIYYLELLSGELRRIQWSTGNRSPIAVADADRTSGLAALEVHFDSAASSDPDADGLTYDWDFGDTASSTDASPVHTYSANGTYTATLTVDDSNGGIATDDIVIVVGNEAPIATIDEPQDGSTYQTGDTIDFSGSGYDPEEGDLEDDYLQWNVILHHHLHAHPQTAVQGASGSVFVEDHGDDTFYEIVLTVTDDIGLHDTERVSVYPEAVELTLDTSLAGLPIVYDGRVVEAPATITTIANSSRLIRAPDPQLQGSAVARFDSWSDTGDNEHVINTGSSDQTLTANYHYTGGTDDTDDDGLADTAEAATYQTNPIDPDTDNDRCLDGPEIGIDPGAGGLRNPTNSWDFFDLPNAAGVRDGTVNMRDISQMIRRYGLNDAHATTIINRRTSPFIPPGSTLSYHPAFDRSLKLDGSRFRLGPPDGGITLFDIMKVIEQYGHSCVG